MGVNMLAVPAAFIATVAAFAALAQAMPEGSPWWAGASLVFLLALGGAARYLLNHDAEQRKLDRDVMASAAAKTDANFSNTYERLNRQDEQAAKDSTQIANNAERLSKIDDSIASIAKSLAILAERDQRREN